MSVDPVTIFSATGGSIAGGGIVGIMAKIIWSQFDRRLVAVEVSTKEAHDKIQIGIRELDKETDKKLAQLVTIEACRHNQTGCSANIGKSLDEVKETLALIRQEILDLYKVKIGNGP